MPAIWTWTPSSPTAPCWCGGSGRHHQVCYNLLDNAIKFSAEGSTMGLSITAKGGKAHVAVRNHGDTIPPTSWP